MAYHIAAKTFVLQIKSMVDCFCARSWKNVNKHMLTHSVFALIMRIL